MLQPAYVAVPADKILTTSFPPEADYYGLLLIGGYLLLSLIVITLIFLLEKKFFDNH